MPPHLNPFARRVESKRSISVFDMRKASDENHRILKSYEFRAKSPFHFEWKKAAGDSYIELLNRGPRNTQSTINLVTTPCNYGGVRWWFECPGCQKRVAKLYEDNDNFYCRTCLGLEYISHQLNYRSIGPMLRRMLKYEKKAEEMWQPQYTYYKGKMTKRARREEKLYMQVERSTPYVLSTVGKWKGATD